MAEDVTVPGWRRDHTRPILPFPQLGAFVRLGPDAFGKDAGDGQIDVVQPVGPELGFEKNAYTIRISREMALDYGLLEPTPEEAAQRAAHAEQVRAKVAEQRAQPGPELTLEAVLEFLRLPAEFAEHLLHPACHCAVLDDDPYLCGWATELGWKVAWESDGRVVRRGGDD